MRMEIIAEIGSNWGGKKHINAQESALASISMASSCGATAAKFQVFRADTLYSKERAKDLYERAKLYELPMSLIPLLRKKADECNVKLWASVFDVALLSEVAEYFDVLKIASGDLTNLELIDAMAGTCADLKKPMAISTGAATKKEVFEALGMIGKDHLVPHLTVFHCKSVYPVSPMDLNLASGLMWKRYCNVIGFSDHTLDIEPAILAYGMGYRAFEKHFRISSIPVSPDFVVSLPPAEFARYSKSLRSCQKVEGISGAMTVLPQESQERVMARRGKDGLRPSE